MTEPNAIAPALSSAGRVPRAGRSRDLLPLACAAHHLHSCSAFLSLSQGAGQSTPVLLSPPVLDENSSLRPDWGECQTIPCFPLRPLGLAWGNVHLSQMLGFLSGWGRSVHGNPRTCPRVTEKHQGVPTFLPRRRMAFQRAVADGQARLTWFPSSFPHPEGCN